MRIFSIGLFFLLSSVTVFGQDCHYTLSGEITDFHNNSPLIGATIILGGSKQVTTTNFEGQFEIKGLCPGTYHLQVSHPACLTKVVTVKVKENTFKEIHLEHHIAQLEEVVISADSHKNTMLSAEEDFLSTKQIAKYSATSLGDILKNISGVSTLNTGNHISKPVIHGLSGSRVLIMNHGTRMQGQEWGAEHAPSIDINTAGSISVIKGASALKYGGDAVGGVIKVIPKKIPRKDSLYGKTTLIGMTNGRGASLTSSLTKSYKNGWFANIQGTWKRYGDSEAPDYVLSNTGYKEKDISFRFGFNTYIEGLQFYYAYFHNKIGILAASHLGGIEDQIRAIESDKPLIIHDFTYDIAPPRQEVSHHLAKVTYFKRFKDFGKWTVQYDFQQNQRLEFDRRRNSAENDRPAINLRLRTHSLQTNIAYNAPDGFKLEFGLVGHYQDNYSNPNTGVKRLIPDYEKYDIGGFLTGVYEISKAISAEAGFRYDYSKIDAYKYYKKSLWEGRNYDQTHSHFSVEDYGNQILTHPVLDYHALSTTVGLAYEFDTDWSLKFNYSLASRTPNPSELFSEGLHHSAARIEIGDLRFHKEVANKLILNLKKEGQNFSFSLNPFLNMIDNFILLQPTGIRQTIRGSFQVWEYRQTDARLLGVNFDAYLKLNEHWDFQHTFSLVKGKNLSQNKPLINMPPVNFSNSLTYSNRDWYHFQVKIKSKYVFEQNEFPNNNFEVFVPVTQTTETVDLSTPPGAYHLLSLHAGINVLKNNKSTLRLGLDITNILNNVYRDYMNRLRYYADNTGRNISVRLSFNY